MVSSQEKFGTFGRIRGKDPPKNFWLSTLSTSDPPIWLAPYFDIFRRKMMDVPLFDSMLLFNWR